jgi:hypothetical protein
MIKQLTHENYHSGLSSMGNDEKWFDMLNFRSINGRTRIVPRKYTIFNHDSGLHTIIQGLGGQHYLIGSKASFVQTNCESATQFPLWQLSVSCSNTKDSTNERTAASQQLLVRGQYTGTDPLSLDVTLVKKPLVAPEVVVTPWEPITCFGCEGPQTLVLDGVVKDIITEEVIPDAEVEFWQYGTLVLKVSTNAFGLWDTALLGGEYVLKIIKPAYQEYTVDVVVTTNDSRVDFIQMTAEASNVIDLLDGLTIEVGNTGTPFHRCDAAIYKVYANNVHLGWANLNNLSDGTNRSTIFVLTTDQAEQVALNTGYSGILNVNLFPDTTHPSFVDNSGFEPDPFDTVTIKCSWVGALSCAITPIIPLDGGIAKQNIVSNANDYTFDLDLPQEYIDHGRSPQVIQLWGTWDVAGVHNMVLDVTYKGDTTQTFYNFENGGIEAGHFTDVTIDEAQTDPGHFVTGSHPHITNVIITDSASVELFNGMVENLISVKVNP